MARRSVRTLKQARSFVIEAGMCGIFSDAKGRMPCLWEAVDLPDRKPGEKGWGEKITAVWRWKNELPATFPDEIFYGKIPGGLAVLMSMERLRMHYPEHHRPVRDCSPLARRIHDLVRLDPLTTAAIRTELGITHRPEKNRVDRAVQELQVTLNIVRRNSPDDEIDTWVPFREQYLEIADR